MAEAIENLVNTTIEYRRIVQKLMATNTIITKTLTEADEQLPLARTQITAFQTVCPGGRGGRGEHGGRGGRSGCGVCGHVRKVCLR